MATDLRRSTTPTTMTHGAKWLTGCSAIAAVLLTIAIFTPETKQPLGAAEDAPRALAATTAVSLDAPSESAPQRRLLTKSIKDIQVGQRVLGRNPLREEVDESIPDVDPATWRKLSLRLAKSDGHSLDVDLLRPLVWIESTGAKVGGAIHLDLPEMGAVGEAKVLVLGPCPPIAAGPGNVCTGKFIHESAGNLINLTLEGQSDPTGVTDNHPYWSEDRQEFVPAGKLRIGERLRTVFGDAKVASVVPRPKDEAVYNIEVYREHVYQVGSLGTLVHNTCPFVRFGSKLEAERSLAINGLHLDPRFNGKFKNVADAGVINPSRLGSKNATQFSHRITFELRDGARDWLKSNGVQPPLGHGGGSWSIPAGLIDEFNRQFVKGVKVTVR